jgi:hypothetical protein
MKQILLFSLDLLLDTRLATLSSIDSAIAASIMSDPTKNKMYRTRINDQFTNLGLEENCFADAYQKRNVDTLKQSRPTRLLFELSTIGNQLIKKSLMEPHNVSDIEFHINFYPYYQLSEEEREAIIGAIKARVQDVILIKGVYLPEKKIDASYLRSSEITGLFFYDFSEWVNSQYGVDVVATDIMQMPSMSVYTTVSFNNMTGLKDAIEFKNDEGQSCDPIMGLHGMFAPYFYLESLAMDSVSIIDPDELIKKEILNK